MSDFRPPVPVLRSFDETKAREFYVDFLGFEVVFTHRFEPDLPLYMGLRLGDCHLHLSEHHGDACPGAHVRIQVSGLDAYQQGLLSKRYGYSRPGCPEERPWGTRDLTIDDPAGNRLTFYEQLPDASAT